MNQRLIVSSALASVLALGLEAGLPMHVIHAAEKANEAQKQFLGQKITKHFGGASQLKGKVIAIWGLAFKPNTDDMREAPSTALIQHLVAHGVRVQAFDPIAHETAPRAFREAGIDASKITFSQTAYAALEGADALALVTEWNEFRTPNFEQMTKLLNTPVLFDGRNLWKPDSVKARGFTYYGVGRS